MKQLTKLRCAECGRSNVWRIDTSDANVRIKCRFCGDVTKQRKIGRMKQYGNPKN